MAKFKSFMENASQVVGSFVVLGFIVLAAGAFAVAITTSTNSNEQLKWIFTYAMFMPYFYSLSKIPGERWIEFFQESGGKLSNHRLFSPLSIIAALFISVFGVTDAWSEVDFWIVSILLAYGAGVPVFKGLMERFNFTVAPKK